MENSMATGGGDADFSEIFGNKDVTAVLKNKFIVVIGDSIQRGIYKDIVLMLQNDRHLTQGELRSKGEFCFLGDNLIEGGKKDKMTNGISYKEIRQYQTDVHLVRFYFMTRCYNSYFETILRDLKKEPIPDVVIMNSCLWDITRYGPDSIKDYKENLQKLFSRFLQSLPGECLVIWTTTLPISSSARGGFLVPEIEFMSTTLRLDLLEANFFAKKLATDHGFDVLDLHFYLRHYLHCRVKDGIHWDMIAHRYITNLLLGHICEAWDIPMPTKTNRTFGSYGSVAGTQKRYNEWENSHHNSGWNYRDQNRGTGGYRENFTGHGAGSSRWNNGFETRNSQTEPHRPWNGPYNNSQAQYGWGGSGNGSSGNALSMRAFSSLENNLYSGTNSLGSQNFHWQSYEENSYHSHAPNRRDARRHTNPYSRSRRY